MDAANERKAIFIPRMVREWKRKTDGAWLTRTNVIRYSTQLTGTVDVARCEAFLKSMTERNEDEQNPSGVLDGVLVQYSQRYLANFFGWDGTGVTEWSAGCATPQPSVEEAAKDLQRKGDGRYDVYGLGKVMTELWFARMRGTLSQIFFLNDCRSIWLKHLRILLLADQGKKINWGVLLDDNFRLQLCWTP